MTRFGIRLVTVLMVIASILTGTDAGHVAAQTPSGRGWVGLGDSYSSGEGISGTNDVQLAKQHQGKDCARATGNGTDATAWSVAAYQTVGGDLGFGDNLLAACTGAVMDNLVGQLNEAKERTGRERFDLVTFSIGGNDIGFADVLKGCLDVDGWGAFDMTPGCDVTEDEMRTKIDEMAARLGSVYDVIATQVNPGGDVIVAGYPHLIEENARWDYWRRNLLGHCEGIQSYDVGMLRSLTGYLNEQIANAVASADRRHSPRGIRFQWLDISQDPYEFSDKATDRHGLCSADPWLNGQTASVTSGDWRLDRSFHPHQAGHTNTGRVLSTFIKNNVVFDDLPPEGVTPEQLRNAQVGELCGVGPGKLKDGSLLAPSGTGGIYALEVDESNIGDLDGDGVNDGILVVECSYGGSLGGTGAFAYGPGPTLLGQITAGTPEGWAPGNAFIRDGTIFVNEYEMDEYDARCCPSRTRQTQWRIDNGSVVEVPTSRYAGSFNVTPNSIGPLRAGMTIEDTAGALGTVADGDTLELNFQTQDLCWWVNFDGFDVGGIGGEGAVQSFHVYDNPEPRTSGGVGVGSSRAQVIAAHPDAVAEDNIYSDEDDLYWYSADKGSAVRFIFNSDTVISLMAGTSGWVHLAEGCA